MCNLLKTGQKLGLGQAFEFLFKICFFSQALSMAEESFRGIQVAMPGEVETTHVALPEPNRKPGEVPSPGSSVHKQQLGLYAAYIKKQNVVNTSNTQAS